MMITIYGLPVTIKYQDLKVLIKQECNIDDFILDYLVSDGEGGKKVRVGLADDAEGSQLMKCLNGYRMSGHVLRLAPVGKSGATNSQPQTYTPRNNFPRNDYSGQTDHGVKPVETRPAPWSTNPQWTANPVAAVNTYNYQQPQTINTPYVQPQAAQAKPQFEPRELATANRVQPHSHTTQSYNYPSKSNLISLGPHRNVSAVPVHNISDSSTRMQASRYPPTYEPEKPITMMKDFQTPQYSSTQTSYQSQTMPWTGPQQQKPYEKPSPVFEKKYDERKYPPVQNKTDITKESFKYDKSEYARYSDDRRQMSPQRHMDRMPIRNLDRQPDRQSERLIDRPSDRHIDRPSDRHIDRPSDRHIDRPSDRNIDRPSDRNSDRPSDRNIDRPSDRHIDRPSDRNIDRPFDRNIDRPTDRHIDRQSDRHIDRPTDRHIERTSDRHIDRQLSHSSGMQRISPSRQIADRITGRRISPDMTRMDRHSPTTHSDRRYSANRQMGQSPTRKMSPHRRISPTARKEEYTRRRLSPPAAAMDRHTSRQSPSRMRHDSPTRQTRYSPRHDKPRDYEEHRAVKEVRPAYETQASKEAMYAGGYRPNVHVDVQYQRKDWQDREKQFSSKNIPEDRRDVARMQKFDIPRASDPQRITEDEKKRSRSRTSRSPRRSPVRDRFRRHSPSPRSPRRSWALEKRRSPETREPPPPPTWPGQDGRLDYQQQRPKFTDRVEKKVWEPSQEKKCDDFSKNDRRNFEDQRVRADVPKWKPLQVNPKEASRFVDDERFQKEAKYARKDFEGRHPLSREDNERKAYPERRDKDYPRSERDETRYKPNAAHKDIIIKQHEEYTGTIEEKKKEIIHKQHQLQKEIDEVYKRAVDFTKKAEMYKKGELKKDFQYRDDKEYDERHKYSYEDDRRGRDDYRKEYPKNYSKADEQKFGNFGKSRDSEDFERKFGANAAIKIKRIKAMDEISEKILNQYASDKSSDIKKRISEELKLSIGKILVEMFGDKDVSFIEMLVKFNARHTQKDEERIFEDVMSCLPSHYRTVKRPSKGDSGISSKVSRRSAEPNLNIDQPILNKQLKGQGVKMKCNEVTKRPVEAENEKKVKLVKINKQKTGTKPVLKEVEDEEETVNQNTKTSKEEVKSNQEDNQEEGKLQLDQLMTHVLEEEVQDIMIQIWKTLPDVSSCDAERFVTQRLRDDGSDELKKIVGLNVTKRLLNVSNPLFVKIQFSCRPESGFLTKFLQTYKITSFKRINQETNTFAAKLNSFADFDNICSAEDIRCGSAKLTVTPCYKFTKCPDNLSTVYANTVQCEYNTHNENTETINENNVKDNGKDKNDIIDRKEALDKTKQEEKTIPVTKTLIKKAKENPKPVKNVIKTNKTVVNKYRMKEIDYENEMFEEINEMDPDFDEEMDDDEILALISGGVVVDQCSGSDRE